MHGEDNSSLDSHKLDAYIESQAEALEIIEQELDEAFKTQAQSFLRASKFANEAAKIANLAKVNLEAVIAARSVAIRAEHVQKGVKLTEAALGELVDVDPTCRREREKLAHANYQAAQYQSVVRAWEHKRDCLIQFGSNVRAGVNSSISLNDEPVHVNRGKSHGARPSPEDDDELVNYANRKSQSSTNRR